MEKQNILIVNDLPSYQISGKQKYNKLLIDNLSDQYNFFELNRKVCYQFENSNDETKVKDFYFSHLDDTKYQFSLSKMIMNPIGYCKLIAKLKKIIKKNNIKLIINSDPLFHLNQEKLNVPVINVLHDDPRNLVNRIKEQAACFKRFKSKCLGQYVYQNNIVCFSEKDVEVLSKYYETKNIHPISVGRLSTKEITSNMNSHSMDKRNKIVYIGRDDVNKGVNKLANVSNIIKDKIGVEIDFYGFKKDKLENYHGPYEYHHLPKILKQAKVCVSYSKPLYESFPIAIVEALSYGVPCVVFDSFYDASYLIDNTNGKLVQEDAEEVFADCVISVYKAKNYASMSKAAYKYALNHLNLDQFVSKWKDLITSLIK